MAGVPYSSKEDLLTGNIPLPGYISADKFVQDASDEIDSQIGFRYETPLDVSDQSPLDRPARLLLKRINNFLASGRLLMTVTSAQEDKTLHAYALNLVKEAQAALAYIADGTIPLANAPVNPNAPAAENTVGISNVDADSAVEAFYGFAMPNDPYAPAIPPPYQWPAWAPGNVGRGG